MNNIVRNRSRLWLSAWSALEIFSLLIFLDFQCDTYLYQNETLSNHIDTLRLQTYEQFTKLTKDYIFIYIWNPVDYIFFINWSQPRMITFWIQMDLAQYYGIKLVLSWGSTSFVNLLKLSGKRTLTCGIYGHSWGTIYWRPHKPDYLEAGFVNM